MRVPSEEYAKALPSAGSFICFCGFHSVSVVAAEIADGVPKIRSMKIRSFDRFIKRILLRRQSLEGQPRSTKHSSGDNAPDECFCGFCASWWLRSIDAFFQDQQQNHNPNSEPNRYFSAGREIVALDLFHLGIGNLSGGTGLLDKDRVLFVNLFDVALQFVTQGDFCPASDRPSAAIGSDRRKFSRRKGTGTITSEAPLMKRTNTWIMGTRNTCRNYHVELNPLEVVDFPARGAQCYAETLTQIYNLQQIPPSPVACSLRFPRWELLITNRRMTERLTTCYQHRRNRGLRPWQQMSAIFSNSLKMSWTSFRREDTDGQFVRRGKANPPFRIPSPVSTMVTHIALTPATSATCSTLSVPKTGPRKCPVTSYL